MPFWRRKRSGCHLGRKNFLHLPALTGCGTGPQAGPGEIHGKTWKYPKCWGFLRVPKRFLWFKGFLYFPTGFLWFLIKSQTPVNVRWRWFQRFDCLFIFIYIYIRENYPFLINWYFSNEQWKKPWLLFTSRVNRGLHYPVTWVHKPL